jgi:hypothetical protein
MVLVVHRFNVCRGTEAQTRALCVAIRDRVFKSAIQRPPPEFDSMSLALVNGMRCTIPSLDHASFLAFIRADLLGIREETIKLSSWSAFILWLMR